MLLCDNYVVSLLDNFTSITFLARIQFSVPSYNEGAVIPYVLCVASFQAHILDISGSAMYDEIHVSYKSLSIYSNFHY